MNSSEFAIVAGGLPIDGQDWQDHFFEAGCDDAVIALQRGLFVLHFDRDADTAEEAITSACSDVRSAGATIIRVEPDPLVSASDIAERAEVTRQAVSLYVNGDRGEAFPAPVACISGTRPLWKWSEVAVWLHAAGKVDHSLVEMALLFDRLNDDQRATAALEDAGAAAPVLTEYNTAGYYLARIRRPIDQPKFRSEPSRNSAHQRPGFRLRPAQSMVQ